MADPDFTHDAASKRRAPFLTRTRRGLLLIVLAAAALAVPAWDFAILPFYEITRLHVTVVPLLLLGLCTTVLFWLFLRIKKNDKDPVRRRPAASRAGLIGFLGLNLAAFLLFDQGWSFIAPAARWAGIVLIVVNVNGACLLLYLFGMQWNRRSGVRTRIHDAVVHSLRQAPAWHELPPYLLRKEEAGWRHASSVYAHAVYFEFARAYEGALEHLQHHLTQRQIHQWEEQEPHAATPRETDTLTQVLNTPLELCLKAGNTLVFYLGYFDDVNGHRAWLAQEIAWRMLNLKLLHGAASLAALPDNANPADVLHADLTDLKRLYRIYQRTVLALNEVEDTDGPSPLDTVVARTGPWRVVALQNRLARLFLHGVYHTRYHEENQNRWAALWRRPLGYATPDRAPSRTDGPAPEPVFFEEVTRVWTQVQALREQGMPFQAWQAEHFFRQLAMQAGLALPLTRFLDTLTALTQRPAPSQEDAAPGTRPAVPGFDADGLDDDLTNLLLALPQLDAEDVNETDFPTLWANAAVLWMLDDLISYERTLSSVQFKDVLQDPLWEQAHPQIRAAVRRLMQTPRCRQRWRENQTRQARKTNDPHLTLRQTWERVPLAS